MKDVTQHIGVLLVVFHISAAQSLKDKRMIMRSIKDRVSNKFNVSISELEDLDKWQLATYGMAMIGNDHRFVEENLQAVLNFLESFPEVQISDFDISFY